MSSAAPLIDHPKTLFEITGAERPPLNWQKSMLVIIDAQRQYETGILALPNIESAVSVIQSLLSEARKRQVPVVHVLHEGGPGLFDPAGEGFQSISALNPLLSEVKILKKSPNAFAGTDLHAQLQRLGKDRNLILVGFMTHMCISATAMAALDLGYSSFVVRDAVATRPLWSGEGRVISDQELNESALAGLRDRISWIVESKELL